MAELRPHYIDVDLKKNTQYNVPVVTQNDTATHFIIRVTDDGLSDPELLDAYQEITMTSQRPDGESFYLTGTRIPGTNEVEFHLGTDETAFSGSVLASLQFYLMEDASRYTSAQFRYDVKKDLTTNYTPTQREETLVEVVLRDGPGVIQEAKDAKIAVDGALVELEQDKTAAIDRLDEVTEENKTVFQQPVNTFADLATTYPNPEHGTTVRVTSEAASYRYSDGTWVKTDEYNPTAIDQVTAQLADKANEEEVRLKSDAIGLNDADPELLAAIEGGEGVTFELLSIPRDKSVNPAKATYFVAGGKNLFNRYTITPGNYVDWETGNLIASPSYLASDYTAIKPSTIYSVSPSDRLRSVAFYDVNKVFISAVQSIPKGGNWTTPANAAYMRETFYTNEVDLSKAQIEEGAATTSYEPYHYFDETVIKPKSLDAGKVLKEGTINEGSVNFFRPSSKNLINHLDFLENTYINPTTGLISSNSSLLFYASDFITVEAGQSYVGNVPIRSVVFYDASKSFLSGNGSSRIAGNPFIVPNGAVYMRINFFVEGSEQGTLARDLIQVEKGTAVTSFEPYFVFDGFLPNGSVTAEKLAAGAIEGSLSKWSGKKFKTLGDSITWQDGKVYSGTTNVAVGYQTILKQRHNFATYDNHGVSGRPMANGTANGDGTNITGKAQTYLDTDLVIIAAGTNDAKLNVPLGTKGVIGDTAFNLTTFYGAYRDLIEFILTQKPKIRIVLFTPLQRDQGGMDVNTENTVGHKLIDYVNAIKEIGELYGLPVCDMYRNSGFTKKTLSTFTLDGLHPNDVGYARMGDCAASFLSAV